MYVHKILCFLPSVYYLFSPPTFSTLNGVCSSIQAIRSIFTPFHSTFITHFINLQKLLCMCACMYACMYVWTTLCCGTTFLTSKLTVRLAGFYCTQFQRYLLVNLPINSESLCTFFCTFSTNTHTCIYCHVTRVVAYFFCCLSRVCIFLECRALEQ